MMFTHSRDPQIATTESHQLFHEDESIHHLVELESYIWNKEMKV